MLHGGTVKIIPSWVPQVTMIDIAWDDAVLASPQPKGQWWGELAQLAGTSGNEGEWEWDAARNLSLWVPVPVVPSYRRLIATLSQFALPIVTGASGTGALQPGLAPVSGDLALAWEGSATT